MQTFQGHSANTDARAAVEEATQGWDKDKLDIVFAFSSTSQDPHEITATFAEKFPGVTVVGCSSTGEILNSKHYNNSLVVAGVHAPEIRWEVALLDDLANLDKTQVDKAVSSLFEAHQIDLDEFDPSKYFCLNFVDGLSGKEEDMSAMVAEALEGIALVGGSAGDDLKFEQTWVFHEGKALSNVATLVMGHSETPFKIIKHQHFTTTPRRLVVTKVDPAARKVIEFDGYPAKEAYAAVLGLTPEELTDEIIFLNPMTFSCNHEIYVRSFLKFEDDGSALFYCAVEEGMVLEVGGHKDMKQALDDDMDKLVEEIGQADFMIACNCILRALEATQRNKHDELGEAIQRASKTSIGFDTYGEQLNGLHINQTVVALAFRSAA